MILGRSYLSSPSSMISAIPSSSAIETLILENAIYDETYVSVDIIDTNNFTGDIPEQWTFDTRLHALYNGDLYGGNVNFTEDIVESVRIKKRTVSDNKFKTIYEKEINSNEDFNIYGLDYFEPVGTIEYAYVPIISGGEGDYIINKIESKFDTYFLCAKDVSYPLIMDAKFDKKLNQKVGIIETWGRQYPVIIKSGNLKYYTGDIQCTFIENINCEWDIKYGWRYRNLIYDFLTDGKPKILKDFEGNIYMVAISSAEISESSDYYRYVTTSFSVTECGNAYNVGDLYDNEFIDTDIDR